jgi:hypothetical protein
VSIKSEIIEVIGTATDMIDKLYDDLSRLTPDTPEYNSKRRQARLFYMGRSILEKYLQEYTDSNFTHDKTISRKVETDAIISHLQGLIDSVWPTRDAQTRYSSEWIKQNRLFKMLFIMKIKARNRNYYLDSSVIAP